MKVKIIKASLPTLWYADKLGKEFEVQAGLVNILPGIYSYELVKEIEESWVDRRLIYECDCIQVPETIIKTESIPTDCAQGTPVNLTLGLLGSLKIIASPYIPDDVVIMSESTFVKLKAQEITKHG